MKRRKNKKLSPEAKLLKRMIEHTFKLYLKADMDMKIYGNSFVEIGERSLIVKDPLSIKDFKRARKIFKDKKMEGLKTLF